MQKVWKDGKKGPLLYRKDGKSYTRSSKGMRILATIFPSGGWIEEGLELRRPERDWKKEEW